MSGIQYRKDKAMVGYASKMSEPAPGLSPPSSSIQYKYQDKKATELLIKMNSAINAEKAQQDGKHRNCMTRHAGNDLAKRRNQRSGSPWMVKNGTQKSATDK